MTFVNAQVVTIDINEDVVGEGGQIILTDETGCPHTRIEPDFDVKEDIFKSIVLFNIAIAKEAFLFISYSTKKSF